MEPQTDSILPKTSPPGSVDSGSLPRRRRRRLLLGSLAAAVLFVFWFVPPVYRLLHGPVAVTRYDRKLGETKATVGPGLKGWMGTKKISRHALHAVIAAEDGRFFVHHGLDLGAIRKSYELNLKKKRYARGGSTISQQVVKMAFLGREKTLLRKAREAAGTLLMELILPKDRILEWYINLAEFGDGVYGIQEGCWHYFKTKPELLTIEQAVNLALVLPSPNAWSRGLRNRRLTPFGHKRYAAILNTMRGMGFVTKTQWMAAITRGDFGRPINGYAELLAAEESHKALCPGSPECPDSADDSPGVDDEEAEELSSPPPVDKASAAPVGAAPASNSAAPAASPAAPAASSPVPAAPEGPDGDEGAP